VAQRVGRGIALLFYDRGTRRGWVVSSTPRPHFTPRKDPVPILQKAGWAPGPVWSGGKSRPHRDSIPDRPARSQSLNRLSYPATNTHTRTHIHTHTHTHTHITDCIETIYELLFLPIILRVKHFYTSRERCALLTGYLSLRCQPGDDWTNMWHWTKGFAVLFWNSNRTKSTAFHMFFLKAFLEALLEM